MKKILILFIFVLITGFGCTNIKDNQLKKEYHNPTIDIKNDSKIDANILNVSKFYDGSDGFSLSIPSGNKSTCIWTWSAGSGDIPDSKITEVETAKNKHFVNIFLDSYDFKVTCVDDFGNIYVGIFPQD